MWPFKRKKKDEAVLQGPRKIGFTQVDITEKFGDNSSLAPEQWIETVPLSSRIQDSESMGLPGSGASEESVYAVASALSRIRESIDLPDDGVYCPVCHVANVRLELLRRPCPKCGRELLKFGWD